MAGFLRERTKEILVSPTMERRSASDEEEERHRGGRREEGFAR
jgi:hypothetical protein